MSRPDYQDAVSDFVEQNDLDAPIWHRLLDVTSELGELAKEAVEASDYGRSDFAPSDHWKEEIGDVFFSLICLANKSGVDLEDALDKVLEKYTARIREKGSPTSGQ